MPPRIPRIVSLFRLALGALALQALVGCANDTPPNTLNILDFQPREADVGDRLEILGTNFPVKRPATVTFDGFVYRPGEEKQAKHVTVEGEANSPERIDLVFNEALSEQFCGPGELAAHTTFRGSVSVSFAGVQATDVPLAGCIGRHETGAGARCTEVTIDLRPPTARRFSLAEGEKQGRDALKFMGIEPASAVADVLVFKDGSSLGGTVTRDVPTEPELTFEPLGGKPDKVARDSIKARTKGTLERVAGGGVLVANVTPGSRADQAGMRPWDVITEVDGVHVASIADTLPSGGSLAAIGVKRPGEDDVRTLQVSMDGFKRTIPSELLGAGLVVAIAAAIVMLFMAPTAGIITWVERRVSARMQSRIGPNRAGPGGFIVWLADGIKSILKEDIIPTESDQPLFRLAPYLVFMGVSATFVVMPFGEKLIAADLDIGILYIIAITSLVTIGLLTAGWASNNKWSLLGGIRAAAQIISYEIPGAVAVVCIVMMTGSLRMQDIIRAQGGLPWEWYMFRNPVTFCLFFLYFTTALAEGNRAPFDLPEAESELVAGYSTEYSGMRYLFFFFAEWANVFVMSGIATALFLGGWQIPFVSPNAQEGSMVLQALGAVLFLTKAWILVFIVVWIRWTLPRVRIDQMMNMCWKWFVPAAFGAFVLTALWLVWQPGDIAVGIISGFMFAFWVVVVGYFFSRVYYNLKTVSTHHLNPYI